MHLNGRLRAVALCLWALGAALGLTLATSAPISAHAQLVSSSPGAGEVVATSPAEVRLVFSEPVDPAYTAIDLLDGQGKLLATGVGKPDPQDGRQFVASLPELADGAYTISWHAISAADGHSTDGFIAFAVGDGTPPPASNGAGAGAGHSHSVTLTLLESAGRSIGILGFMAALGLAIFGWIVRSTGSVVPRRIVEVQTLAMLAAAAGVLLLAYAVAAGAGGQGLDLLQYLTAVHSGQLLLFRLEVACLGFLIGLVLILMDRPVLAVGFVTGIAGIVLNAGASHASAFASLTPMLAQIVHVGAASAWIGGLLGFAVLFLLHARPAPPMAAVVRRFSAVGLVAVALITLTGAYSDWIQTRDPLSLGTQYQVVLAAKIVLFLAAIGIGAVNYLRAADEPVEPAAAASRLTAPAGDQAPSSASSLVGRMLQRIDFRRRVLLEAGLAIAIVVASGLLSSGSPPGSLQPVGIQPALSSASAQLTASLALLPGRAGPNQIIVSGVSVPQGDALTLILQRLDQSSGASRFPITLDTAGSGVASGVTLPDGSRWDATVAIENPDGTEAARARFVYGVDVDGLTEGEAVPPIDPAVLIALILLVGAVLGLTFGLAGGALPRTDPRWSRLALVSGSGVAGVLGAGMLFLGGSVR